jgi:hypothetical protein
MDRVKQRRRPTTAETLELIPRAPDGDSTHRRDGRGGGTQAPPK